MSNPTDKFVTNRMSDSTDLSDVDDGVNGLESAVRTVFGVPADTVVTPFRVGSDGTLTVLSGLAIGSGGTPATAIVSGFGVDGNDDDLASVKAIRDYGDLNWGGTGLSFTYAQRYGSLWVGSNQSIGIGAPAYWQIVGRAPLGEGPGDFTVANAGSQPPDDVWSAVPWTHTLYEHPLFEENEAWRPCKTQLSTSDIKFTRPEMQGLWSVSVIIEAPNWNGETWKPCQWNDSGLERFEESPCWTLRLRNTTMDRIEDECRVPQIVTMRKYYHATPPATLELDDTVIFQHHVSLNGDPQCAFGPPAKFLQTLRLNATFYVDQAAVTSPYHTYRIELQQMSGANITVGENAFRAMLRYIPTNGG